MTTTDSYRSEIRSSLIESVKALLEYDMAPGIRLAIPGTDNLIMVGTGAWIAKNVPEGDAGALTDERILRLSEETAINYVTDERRPDNATIIDFARAIERVVAAHLASKSLAAEPKLEDIEQYRLQMAGITTAALGYWKEGDRIHPDYDTVALRDVAKLYAKYEALAAPPNAREAQADDKHLQQLVLDVSNASFFCGRTDDDDPTYGPKLEAAVKADKALIDYMRTFPRPNDDDLWEQTLRDRDTYHEWADKLADAIAKYFGADIGEHSNMNCPWAEALDVIESAAPAVAQEATAQGEPVGFLDPASGTFYPSKISVEKYANRPDRVRALYFATPTITPSQAAVDEAGDQWISVDERLPAENTCLAAYQPHHRGHKPRVIRAVYIHQYQIEATGDDGESTEYNEADDKEYIKAGWYERIDNWGDFASVAVCEGEVTHWMPLPAAPDLKRAGDSKGASDA